MLTEVKGYTNLTYMTSGGFSDVYIGIQDKLNREVAIKVTKPQLVNQAEFIQRFEFEADLIARLEHPHIVPIYDYWHDKRGAFLVMRYIRGGNLTQHLLEKPLEIEAAARLLEQIAGALSVAHRNNIVHQDIKPDNILLDEDGNAYLIDFGIACDLVNEIDMAHDANNRLHGSPNYIAPEQLRGAEITHRSDIYSLGILMYEALTRHIPFDSTSVSTILQNQIHSPLPKLQEANINLPDALNDPLQKATMKDPLARYDNVMDFASEFQQVVTKLHYEEFQTLAS